MEDQTTKQTKKFWVGGFGHVLCLKCGKEGSITCTVRNGSVYWHVDHQNGLFTSKKVNQTTYILTKEHTHSPSCYFGSIDDDKLDEILQSRTFPLTAIEAHNHIERKLKEISQI